MHRSDVLVLFGATGDLARNKLFSSLYHLSARGRLDLPVIGVALSDWDDERFRAHAREAISATVSQPDPAVVDQLCARLSLIGGDYAEPDTYVRLRSEVERRGGSNPTLYLAIPPAVFPALTEGLARQGLNTAPASTAAGSPSSEPPQAVSRAAPAVAAAAARARPRAPCRCLMTPEPVRRRCRFPAPVDPGRKPSSGDRVPWTGTDHADVLTRAPSDRSPTSRSTLVARHENVAFTGAADQRLVGRLDLPDGAPDAHALFAHCFTCGKDSHAAARISRALTGRGIGVLRFDVTGLGESGGDFADVTFSGDTADLVLAAEHLRSRGAAPRLLVGHSLGGAAVLAAAAGVPDVRAVATIGAPADASHVTGLLGAAAEEMELRGEAMVTLGGRPFRLRHTFLDDIRRQPQSERIGALGRPLLVMHSPSDPVVGIDNARQVFELARHPKSFIALDGMDHLLSSPADAAYTAEVLAAWSSRYVRGISESAGLRTGRRPARSDAAG